jgi:hypothetical protein
MIELQVHDTKKYVITNFSMMATNPLSKGCHLDVVSGPSTPHDPESNAGGSLISWQGHQSR